MVSWKSWINDWNDMAKTKYARLGHHAEKTGDEGCETIDDDKAV